MMNFTKRPSGSRLLQIESILEKGSSHINEDALHVETDLFGVFDGATSLNAKRFSSPQNSLDALTGGAIASSTACKVFSCNGDTLERLALSANLAIRQQMIAHGVDLTERASLWSTSAAVARLHAGDDNRPNALEWIQTGDAFILLLYDNGAFKVLGDPHDHDFDTLSMWKDLNGKRQKANLVIGEALKDKIRTVRMGMNRHYGVLNGETEAESFLMSGVEPLDGVTDILIFTDGLAIPSPMPTKRKCFRSLVDAYRSRGLKRLVKHIRSLEKSDPNCTRYPRFKCHDDMAAIAIQFN